MGFADEPSIIISFVLITEYQLKGSQLKHAL